MLRDKSLPGRIAAEVSRLVAESDKSLHRDQTTWIGQLCADAVGAYLTLGEDRQREIAATGRGIIEMAVASVIAEAPPKSTPDNAPEWFVEDWAGPVAGPTLLENEYGIARSTLYRWQKLRMVVAFPKGRRKYVFPLLQFVDGRPVDRLSDVLAYFSDDRECWRWLVTPIKELGGRRPIDDMRNGKTSEALRILFKW